MSAVGGEGWQAVRPERGLEAGSTAIDSLIPQAEWFWGSLQRLCVPDCCGLAAYDFSAESVAWACGWGTARPEESDWRDDSPGDARELAVALRSAAQEIRKLDASAVS